MILRSTNSRSGLRREGGNTLLIVLSVAAILLPIIWTAVYFASVQQRTVTVSQDWNSGMAVIEAGIEEAFAHLNTDCKIESTAAWNANDWSQSGDTFSLPPRYFADGSFYQVQIITNGGGATAKTPDIVCIGGVQTRFGVRGYANASGQSGPQFATVSASQEVERTNNFIKRQVRVRASQWGWPDFGQLGGTGVGVNGSITAFDSSGTSSYWGHFMPSLASGDAVVGSVNGDISLSPNSETYGSVVTSPNNSVTGSGSVGDTNWVDSGTDGVQPGHYNNNLEMEMPQIPSEPSVATMEGWSTLFTCSTNCTVSFIRPATTNGTWIETNVNPLTVGIMVPGGFVHTNTNAVYYSTTYTTIPRPPTGFQLITNTFTGIGNVPANSIEITNWLISPYWATNLAENVTTAAQNPLAGTYITSQSTGPSGLAYDNYKSGGGIFVVTNPVAYTSTSCGEQIPSTAYSGTLTTDKVNGPACYNPGGGGDKIYSTNFTYHHIAKKVFQRGANTNYMVYYTNWSYGETIYGYYGPRTNAETVVHTYEYIAPGGDWQLPSLDLSGDEKFLITGGKNRIYVPGQFSIRGRAQIIIAPGSSVEFYMGDRVDLGGNGIANEDDKASSLLIYGLDTCTEMNISGNARLTAGILAPNADIQINGGGSRGLIVGAICGASITSNGNPVDFANDKDLARHISTPFYATEWAEETVGYTP
jgi:hypothetical protein